ncbi:hypothetical protein KM043_009472 [Ampulex compressa]|nr:hypothetical protein KM043_009472 [Ampulex compressa]
MAYVEHLRPDLRAILEEFATLRDAYVALKTYSVSLEELVKIEKHHSAQEKKNAKKMTKTFRETEQQHMSAMNEMRREKDELRKTVEELQQQCDHLRIINTERDIDNEQIYKLQDEVEVLQAQLALEQQNHVEELEAEKKRHYDELQRFKKRQAVLQEAGTISSTFQSAKKIYAANTDAHPALKSEQKTKRKYQSQFRWPDLEVQKIGPTSANEEGKKEPEKKRKKLFHENSETMFDIA